MSNLSFLFIYYINGNMKMKGDFTMKPNSLSAKAFISNFLQSDEIRVPNKFMEYSNLSIGDMVTISVKGHDYSSNVKIVGTNRANTVKMHNALFVALSCTADKEVFIIEKCNAI